MDLQFAKRSLEMNKHNHVTTTYYLTQIRLIKQNGGKPLHEKNSLSHDPNMFMKARPKLIEDLSFTQTLPHELQERKQP
jgi:hypothetical protein